MANAEAGVPILRSPVERSQLIRKYLDAGEDWGQEVKQGTKDEMIGWHHRLNEYELEEAPGVSKEQGDLAP